MIKRLCQCPRIGCKLHLIYTKYNIIIQRGSLLVGLELAIKDTFVDHSEFGKIGEMLLKLHPLYQRELGNFMEAIDHAFPNRTHRDVLESYIDFMALLESLATSDPQAVKHAEFVGYVKWWQNACYPIHILLSLCFQTQ